MSGLVSGITKIFTSLGTGAAALGSAVRGVGASLFTAAAANGGKLANIFSAGSSVAGLFGKGDSTLGRMLSGAATVLNLGSAIGSIAPASAAESVDTLTHTTESGYATGGADGSRGAGVQAELSSQPGYAGSPLIAADTATGAAAAGASATTTQEQGDGMFKGLGDFLKTEGGAGLISGLGTGIGEYLKAQSEEDMREADRQFLRDKEQRITDSYKVSKDALVGGTTWSGDPAVRPTPAVTWSYNSTTGQIEKAA